MSANTFITSDLHFGHNNVINFRTQSADVDEHDEAIIDNWNSMVRPQDNVWVLGDVAFNKRGLAKVARLNGRKRLIMGNHDRFAPEAYLEHFYKLHGCIQKHQFLFTHVPVHPMELDRFVGNVHGHLHHERVLDPEGNPDLRYFSVCLEHTNMQPVELDFILEECSL